MSAKETYSLAHTARCKLKMAADRPDRDLRFILGHAFTLDKVMLRVVEIEHEEPELPPNDITWPPSSDHDERPTCGMTTGRRVSFQNMTNKPLATRHRSPPAPVKKAEVSSSSGDEDEDDDDDYDDEDEIVAEDDDTSDEELSLRRFGSGAAKKGPPQLVDDDDDSDSDEEDNVSKEPKSPEQMPSDAQLRGLCGGKDSKELRELYGGVKDCPCHGHEAPGVNKVWDWGKVGEKRIAVVQFADGEDVEGF